jgi:hypothetical protein
MSEYLAIIQREKEREKGRESGKRREGGGEKIRHVCIANLTHDRGLRGDVIQKCVFNISYGHGGAV